MESKMKQFLALREKQIYEHLQQPKRLEIIEGGDHVFSDPSHRERVINLALDWFDKYLLNG